MVSNLSPTKLANGLALLSIASCTNSLYELLYDSDRPMSQLGTKLLVRGVPTWFPAAVVGVADRDATSHSSLGLSLCMCIWVLVELAPVLSALLLGPCSLLGAPSVF